MYTYSTKIFFAQCDPAGVIFFGEVFKIAHECYERFIDENKYEAFLFESLDHAFPIVQSDAKYYSPLRLHENVSIQLYVEQIGDSSYTLLYKFISGDKLKAEVRTVHVCISRENGKKQTIPSRLKEILSNNLV